jgi:Tol biopolymer transport system component
MTGSGGPGFYRKDIRGGAPELVEKHDPAATTKVVSDWSRDGQVLIYTQNDPKTNADIWYVPLVAGKPSGQQVKFLGTTALESQGQMSPDGHWLAYASNESGTFEVYIRSFPTGDRVWRVSAEGGSEPRGRADGRELFFRAGPTGQLPILAVGVAPDGRGGLRTGRPQRLFAVPSNLVQQRSNAFAYSPHPAGQRFLVNALTDARGSTVNVVTNWQKAAAGWK